MGATPTWVTLSPRLLPINQNAALFSLLGVTYGGDGRTTFALPDLRGRMAIHPNFSSGTGLVLHNLGDKGGSTSLRLTASSMAHTHPVRGTTDGATSNNPSDLVWASKSRTPLYGTATNLTPMAADLVTSVAGSGKSFTVEMPPYLALNYIIAVTGVFPSRN